MVCPKEAERGEKPREPENTTVRDLQTWRRASSLPGACKPGDATRLRGRGRRDSSSVRGPHRPLGRVVGSFLKCIRSGWAGLGSGARRPPAACPHNTDAVIPRIIRHCCSKCWEGKRRRSERAAEEGGGRSRRGHSRKVTELGERSQRGLRRAGEAGSAARVRLRLSGPFSDRRRPARLPKRLRREAPGSQPWGPARRGSITSLRIQRGPLIPAYARYETVPFPFSLCSHEERPTSCP